MNRKSSTIHQQLSGNAAGTILSRFLALFGDGRFPDPKVVIKLSVETLRSAGLSRPKVAYILGIAEIALAGDVPTLSECDRMGDSGILIYIYYNRSWERFNPPPTSLPMAGKYLDLMFTPAVIQAQEKYFGNGPRMQTSSENDPMGPNEIDFIDTRDSFYLATVSETGWPYVQHRGGMPGFLKVIDSQTLVFADYKGNRQMLSTGNLAVNDRASLFLMYYPSRTRLKILGHIRVEDAREHPELVQEFADPEVQKIVERIFFINVVSYDWNCPKYITPRYTAAEIEELVTPLKNRVAELESQLNSLKSNGKS